MLKIKQLMLAVFALVLFISCGNSGKKAISFNGDIQNPESDSIYLIGDNNFKKAIPLNNGAFSDTLSLAKPAYLKFYAGRQFTWVYMIPGDNLTLKTDMNSFDESLKYEGKTAAENNFLAYKMLKDQEMTGNPSEFFSKNPDDFKKTVTSFKSRMIAELEKSSSAKEFKEIEKKNIEFAYLMLLAQYPEANSFFTKQNTPMPDEFAKEIGEINLDDNTSYEMIPSYKDIVLYQNSIKIDNAKSAADVEKLISDLKSDKIKDDVMANLLMYTISSGGTNAQAYYDIVQKYAKDEDLKKRASAEFESVKKLLPGSPSPEFVFPDINGNDVELSDLKGKLVYIDVWATWCVPCLQEIPSLKQLESDYHGKDIHFVSMSIDQRKDFEKWQNMVKEKDLKGIQIFADKDWSSQFVREYNINGIPRFILLDRDGKIINADAPRPSDANIRLLIDENI